MAKLSKRIRKGAKRLARSEFVRDVLEKLVVAAILGAAAKIAESRTAAKVKRKAKTTLNEVGGGKAPSKRRRK